MQTRRKTEITIETHEVTVIRVRASTRDVFETIENSPLPTQVEKSLAQANMNGRSPRIRLRAAMKALVAFLAVLAGRKNR